MYQETVTLLPLTPSQHLELGVGVGRLLQDQTPLAG